MYTDEGSDNSSARCFFRKYLSPVLHITAQNGSTSPLSSTLTAQRSDPSVCRSETEINSPCFVLSKAEGISLHIKRGSQAVEPVRALKAVQHATGIHSSLMTSNLERP